MDPWSAIAKAIVYPLARAVCDAYFDAWMKNVQSIEERINDTDTARASRFRDAVRMLDHPKDGSDPKS